MSSGKACPRSVPKSGRGCRPASFSAIRAVSGRSHCPFPAFPSVPGVAFRSGFAGSLFNGRLTDGFPNAERPLRAQAGRARMNPPVPIPPCFMPLSRKLNHMATIGIRRFRLIVDRAAGIRPGSRRGPPRRSTPHPMARICMPLRPARHAGRTVSAPTGTERSPQFAVSLRPRWWELRISHTDFAASA